MPKVASAKGGERKGKPKKDANAPKRNLSAYFLFCAEERPRVKASDSGLSLGDTAKELGRRWAAVDAATKSRFEKLAQKDKERYEKEKNAYKGGATGKAAGGGGGAAKSPVKAGGGAKKAGKGGKAPVQEESEDEDEEDDDEDEE